MATKAADKKKADLAAAKDTSKAAALAAFLKDQDKERPGEVMLLNDTRARVNIRTVSTGAISLDLAINGGIPFGRITEIFGPEGGGKCLVAGTTIWTDHGLETIEEFFGRLGQKASCTSRVTDVRGMGAYAVNEEGELEQVAALTHNNKRTVTRLTLGTGRSIEATANHPFRVMDTTGYIVWKNAGSINEGDVVVSAAFGAAEAKGGSGLSIPEATLLGYLSAEGSLGYTTSTRFTNWDPQVRDEYRKLVKDILGVGLTEYYDKEQVIFSKEIRTLLAEKYGLDYSLAAGKKVPYCVRTGGADVQRAYLSALYEGDGWVADGPKVGFTVASEDLAKGVQLLLLGLGVPSSLRSFVNPEYDRTYWKVLVSQTSFGRFINEVGFRTERRATQVENALRGMERIEAEDALLPATRSEGVPHIGELVRTLVKSIGGSRESDRLIRDLVEGRVQRCSRDRLRKIVAWADTQRIPVSAHHLLEHLRTLSESRFVFDDVVKVEDAGTQPTFDLMVPETHSFIANGICSHNTTLALTAAKNCQDEGGIVGFIDAEHGLNRDLCEAIGIDQSRFVIAQPDSGEEAIDRVSEMLDSGAFDMIIVDSVAAMTPKAEIEGDVTQQFMGLAARLMSRFMRRVAGKVNEKGVALVLLNQVRTNLQAYGAPDQSTGGKAIKFYASLRIEVRSNINGKKIERNKQIIGQMVTAVVKKNRLGAPGRQAEFDVIFGKGIEGSGSLLDVAETIGIVVRAGASYTEVATGERIGIGKENVKAILGSEEGKELKERLEAAIYAHLHGTEKIEAEEDPSLAAEVEAEHAEHEDETV